MTVFADKADPGYQALLALCVAGKDSLSQGTRRFDMPDFRPRADWVREMKRYGILPAGWLPLWPARLLRSGTPVLGIPLVQARLRFPLTASFGQESPLTIGRRGYFTLDVIGGSAPSGAACI